MKYFLFTFCCLASLLASAQRGSKDYAATDEIVKKLGRLDSLNVARIADTITRPFSDKEQKARAIYYWIASNIAIDLKATKQNDKKNTVPEKVIEMRKTTPLGFSLLVQEMCSDADIRCISVDGFYKKYASDINDIQTDINHSWNVIQLGQSPDTWYLVDACRAAGFTDKKMTVFTPQFTSEFFFADRKLFNLSNYPDNIAWQLGGGPKSLREYYAAPVIGNYAFTIGLRKPAPETGYIKAKLNKEVTFTFNTDADIKEITIITGDEKKQSKPETVNFTNTGSTVKFGYKFKKEDSFPLRILADGKVILEYMVEVNE